MGRRGRRKDTGGAPLAPVNRQSTLTVQRIESMRSGPLPDAEELARYDAITPGLAKEIVAMARTEQTHRHGRENAVIAGEHKRQARGQLYALAAALALCVVAVNATVLGASEIGCTALGVIGAAIAAFLIERRAERKAEREEPERGP